MEYACRLAAALIATPSKGRPDMLADLVVGEVVLAADQKEHNQR